MARELRSCEGKPILEAAVEAATPRFRPILMTSFAFILGVLPLVTATGAGATRAYRSASACLSGMIASTCLAVLFVPSFFVVLQRLEEARLRRKTAKAGKGGAADAHGTPEAAGCRRLGNAEACGWTAEIERRSNALVHSTSLSVRHLAAPPDFRNSDSGVRMGVNPARRSVPCRASEA